MILKPKTRTIEIVEHELFEARARLDIERIERFRIQSSLVDAESEIAKLKIDAARYYKIRDLVIGK